MSKAFFDTSAILAGALKDQTSVYISPIVLQELEHIKTAENKPDSIKYLAREAVRDILNDSRIRFTECNNRKIDKLLKKYSFLNNINDHRIICEAVLLADKEPVEFYTNDST